MCCKMSVTNTVNDNMKTRSIPPKQTCFNQNYFFFKIDYSYLKSAAVPMWAVYQFLVSVVLLRILIVMMTITYRRIYDDLDKQWK